MDAAPRDTIRSESARWKRVLASPWLHPLNDLDTFDELIQPLGSHWALSRLLARVDEVVQETSDTRTFWLRPNWHWRGFAAGQSIRVAYEINGRRHWRHYSLSSDPADKRRIAITVKRQPGGKLSNALHDQLGPGEVLMLEPAGGDFVLPDVLPDKLLMLSAGSGITPLRALLYALWHRGYAGEIRFVHVCRSREHLIFGEQLERWALDHPGLRLRCHYTAASGRPAPLRLVEDLPDLAERTSFLCGPDAMMLPLREHWRQLGIGSLLRWERYGVSLPATGEHAESRVRCERSGRSFVAISGRPLLLEAERAGLAPDYGCRRGICHSCRYRKTRGIVENLLTGEVSAEPDEMIQLCVCTARSELEFADL